MRGRWLRWCDQPGSCLCSIQIADKSGNITDLDINDIEDLCTLCEPLPNTGLVTAFPMKAQRKKAREELDIVNVVEWRHQDSQDRWFLLVRRPQGGRLFIQ